MLAFWPLLLRGCVCACEPVVSAYMFGCVCCVRACMRMRVCACACMYFSITTICVLIGAGQLQQILLCECICMRKCVRACGVRVLVLHALVLTDYLLTEVNAAVMTFLIGPALGQLQQILLVVRISSQRHIY